MASPPSNTGGSRGGKDQDRPDAPAPSPDGHHAASGMSPSSLVSGSNIPFPSYHSSLAEACRLREGHEQYPAPLETGNQTEPGISNDRNALLSPSQTCDPVGGVPEAQPQSARRSTDGSWDSLSVRTRWPSRLPSPVPSTPSLPSYSTPPPLRQAQTPPQTHAPTPVTTTHPGPPQATPTHVLRDNLPSASAAITPPPHSTPPTHTNVLRHNHAARPPASPPINTALWCLATAISLPSTLLSLILLFTSRVGSWSTDTQASMLIWFVASFGALCMSTLVVATECLLSRKPGDGARGLSQPQERRSTTGGVQCPTAGATVDREVGPAAHVRAERSGFRAMFRLPRFGLKMGGADKKELPRSTVDEPESARPSFSHFRFPLKDGDSQEQYEMARTGTSAYAADHRRSRHPVLSVPSARIPQQHEEPHFRERRGTCAKAAESDQGSLPGADIHQRVPAVTNGFPYILPQSALRRPRAPRLRILIPTASGRLPTLRITTGNEQNTDSVEISAPPLYQRAADTGTIGQTYTTESSFHGTARAIIQPQLAHHAATANQPNIASTDSSSSLSSLEWIPVPDQVSTPEPPSVSEIELAKHLHESGVTELNANLSSSAADPQAFSDTPDTKRRGMRKASALSLVRPARPAREYVVRGAGA